MECGRRRSVWNRGPEFIKFLFISYSIGKVASERKLLEWIYHMLAEERTFQMWRRARFGETFYLTKEELTCPAGRENLGLIEQTAVYNGLRAADYSNSKWIGTGTKVKSEDKSRVYDAG